MITNPITKGKYAQNWPVVLFFGGLGLLLLAAGVWFLFQDGAEDVALYPGLSGLLSLLVAAIYFGMQGTFEVGTASFEGKRRMGGPWSVGLDEIGEIKLTEFGMDLFSREGKRLRSFKKVSPERARGAAWMYHHYRDKLPNDLLAGVGQKAVRKDLPEGLQPASRTFSKPGSPTLRDHGLLIRQDDRFHYIPETRTESPGSALQLISPVIITRYAETPGIPNRSLLPILQVVRATWESAYEERDKFQYLGLLVMTHLGGTLPESAMDTEGNLVESLEDGTEVRIQPE